MRRESSQKLVGNDQFEGYAIDLIYEISRLLGFNYTLKLVPDGRYGSYNEDTKEWDGMMGELLQQVRHVPDNIIKTTIGSPAPNRNSHRIHHNIVL